MKITGLHTQRRHSGRANLHVDGELECGVAWELVQEHRLRVGDEVSPGVLERLRLADACWKAKEAALSLLATRARAHGELRERLRRRGFEQAAVDHAVAEASRLGLIDDRAFAEAWVRDRLRARPRGSRALAAELARKGLEPDVSRAAIAAVMRRAETGDAELCMRAAEKWLRTRAGRPAPDDPDAQRRAERRLAAYLGRRGFAAADVHAALRAARDTAPEM